MNEFSEYDESIEGLKLPRLRNTPDIFRRVRLAQIDQELTGNLPSEFTRQKARLALVLIAERQLDLMTRHAIEEDIGASD